MSFLLKSILRMGPRQLRNSSSPIQSLHLVQEVHISPSTAFCTQQTHPQLRSASDFEPSTWERRRVGWERPFSQPAIKTAAACDTANMPCPDALLPQPPPTRNRGAEPTDPWIRGSRCCSMRRYWTLRQW